MVQIAQSPYTTPEPASSQLAGSASASTHALAPAVHAPRSRAQIFDSLSKELPTNELGLPKYMYRGDLIPPDYDRLSPSDQRATLNSATIPVTYREGYPTFADGTPIWDQMDAEGDSDYGYFQLYLQMSDTKGYRQLSTLPGLLAESFPHLRASNRQEEKAQLLALHELCSCNFWLVRAKAKDLFQVAMFRKVREQRMMSMQDYHFTNADKLLTKMMQSAEDVFTAEKIGAMEPLEFAKTMKEFTIIQRGALGMESNGSKGKGDNASAPGMSVEVTMQQVAKATHANQTGNTTSTNKAVLDILQGDPEAVAAAQSLIVRVGVGGREAAAVNSRTAVSDEQEDYAMITGETSE